MTHSTRIREGAGRQKQKTERGKKIDSKNVNRKIKCARQNMRTWKVNGIRKNMKRIKIKWPGLLKLQDHGIKKNV